jgi:hypothetical protein
LIEWLILKNSCSLFFEKFPQSLCITQLSTRKRMELQSNLGRRLRLSVSTMAMMSALAACGGGGGGGDTTPPDNPGDNAVTANDDTFASIGSSSGGSAS